MRKPVLTSILFILLQGILFTCLVAADVAAQQRPDVIDNPAVMQMVRAGLSDSIIVAKIRISDTSLDTSTNALLDLHKNGVSDAVLSAMIDRSAGKQATAPVPLGPGDKLVEIPEGTEIKIVTIDKISGKKAVEGASVTFKVLEDVKVGDRIVIAKDAVVKGLVSQARKPGMMGRSGKLSLRIESAQTIDGQVVKLRAAKSGAGGDNFGTTFALSYVIGPFALLTTGKNAKIKAGTVFSAFTDEAKWIVLAGSVG